MSLKANKFKMRLVKEHSDKKLLCGYCGSRGTMHDLTLDHIVPLSRGGSDSIKNLVLCCQQCNHHKGSRLLIPIYGPRAGLAGCYNVSYLKGIQNRSQQKHHADPAGDAFRDGKWQRWPD